MLADGWVMVQFEDDKKCQFTLGSLQEAPKSVPKNRVEWLVSSDVLVTETAGNSSATSGSHVLSEDDEGMGEPGLDSSPDKYLMESDGRNSKSESEM